MILEHEQWLFGYDQILKDCRDDNGSKTVLLLCNADVDAMSCARIISYMLRSDGVHYQLMLCKCYSDLESTLTDMANEGTLESVSSVLLLNFGAALNLTQLFRPNLLQQEDHKIFVLDCKRPIHLANVYSPDNVVVFLDATQSTKDMPSDGDNLSGGESSSSEEDSDDSDSDDDDSDHSIGDEEEEFKSDDEGDNAEVEADFNDVSGDARVQDPSKNESDPSYDAEDEQDDDNDDDPNEKDASPRESKRQKIDSKTAPAGDKQDTSGGDDDEEDNKENSDNNAQPTQETVASVSPRELHKDRMDRLRKYYNEGSFYGSPSSFVAYSLASQQRFAEKGDLLWLACVGVTDAYLHSRLDLIGYAKLAGELSLMVQKLFPNQAFDRALSTVYAEDLVGSGSGSTMGQTKISLSENGRIVSEKDFRFFLLRHSSLLDSMQYSEYVCTKLALHTKQGEQKLLELLARMGYPLDECKQPFPFMRPSLRRRLKDKLGTHAPEYNLDRFQFTSFTRVTGYSSLLSASDTSYAVTALLEYEAPTRKNNENSLNEDLAEKEKAAGIEAFNNAYDALGGSRTATSMGGGGSFWSTQTEGHDSSNLVNGGNLSSSTGIGAGLRFAMVLQKKIIHTAIGLMERNAITTLRHFRYAHVSSSSLGGDSSSHIIRTQDLIRQSTGGVNAQDTKNGVSVFSKPLALTRLAHFLMDMNRESGKWTGTNARPLVMIADKPITNSCLIVGYEYPERAGDFVRNVFGKHFEMTAKSMNGTFKFDSFDSNVIEVGAADVQRFMEQLHYLLDAI